MSISRDGQEGCVLFFVRGQRGKTAVVEGAGDCASYPRREWSISKKAEWVGTRKRSISFALLRPRLGRLVREALGCERWESRVWCQLRRSQHQCSLARGPCLTGERRDLPAARAAMQSNSWLVDHGGSFGSRARRFFIAARAGANPDDFRGLSSTSARGDKSLDLLRCQFFSPRS